MCRSGADHGPRRGARLAGLHLALAGALAGALAVPPLVAQEPEPAAAIQLSSPVLDVLARLQEEWLEWLNAHYQDDQERAATALDSLLANARELGLERLPELSRGAAAAALRAAAAGESERASRALIAAGRLDPGSPEVAFATARVARDLGELPPALTAWMRGVAGLLGRPLERFLLLGDLGLWLLGALLLAGAGFVAVEMALRGGYLLRSVAAAVERPLPGVVAFALAAALLLWPVLLPAGVAWLVLYWSLLVWPEAGRLERTVLAVFWLLALATPWLLDEQRQRAQVALSPGVLRVESVARGGLEGGLFSDLSELRAELPESVALTHLLADLNRMLGQIEPARELYLQVLEKEPQNVPALVDAGACFFRRGDYERAIEHFRRAADAGPREAAAAAYFNLSQAFSELYRFGDAERQLRLAQELDNDAVAQWIHLVAAERVVTLGRGLRRSGEIRRQLLVARRSAGGPWPRAALWGGSVALPVLGLFVLLAVGVAALTRRARMRRLEPAPWWRGGLETWRRVLLPGFVEAEHGRWGTALLALLALALCLALPLAGRLAYPIPQPDAPGADPLWLLAGLGLGGIVLARFWRYWGTGTSAG